MTESVHPVIAAAQQFRQRLLNQEAQATTRLISAYGNIYARMGDQIAELETYISATAGGDLADRQRLRVLRSLRAQIEDEVNRFAIFADQEIVLATRQAIQSAISDSRQVAGAYFTSRQAQQAFAAAWDVLPTDAVEAMVGFLADDSPLRTRLVGSLGQAVADSVERNLIDAIGLGFNPRRTAEIIRSEMGVGLTWALNTARTAQLYAYREATRASYMANSDVVDGWYWFATLGSNRTCMSCINQHGRRYPTDATLTDHHQGRCVPIPIVPLAGRLGIPMPEPQPGEEWFNEQPRRTQVELMGPAMYDAWRARKFAFGDLSQPYQDPVYGEMLREASLVGLLGREAERYYR